jgi:hypothetical protein
MGAGLNGSGGQQGGTGGGGGGGNPESELQLASSLNELGGVLQVGGHVLDRPTVMPLSCFWLRHSTHQLHFVGANLAGHPRASSCLLAG